MGLKRLNLNLRYSLMSVVRLIAESWLRQFTSAAAHATL
jgi:hypothetical protein